MLLSTFGHATLSISTSHDSSPILVTDPWLYGSCYYRSWHLDNYPTKKDISFLSSSSYLYYTHEHPDHFHTPSLRKFFTNKSKILVPSIPSQDWTAYIESSGFHVSVLSSCRWYMLDDDVQILSIPLWTNDSILLIRSGSSLIVNLNDSKPPRSLLSKISDFAVASNLEVILLSSYSPASIINSFLDQHTLRAIKLRDRTSYFNYILDISSLLNAKYFLPFASQSIQMRESSRWASVYKVTYAFLRDCWDSATCPTCLIPPYSTLDLSSCTFLSNSHSIAKSSSSLVSLTKQRDHQSCSESDCLNAIRSFFTQSRFLHLILIVSGVRSLGFQFESSAFRLSLFSGSIIRDSNSPITFVMPSVDFVDAIKYSRFVDLGISMLLRIKLSPKFNPKIVYSIFLWLQLSEYGHLTPIGFFKVLLSRVRCSFNLFSIPLV